MSFVNDFNSLVSLSNPLEQNLYSQTYLKILEYVYTLNKLKINREKTNLLIIAKPKVKDQAGDIKIKADEGDVNPKN